MAVFNYEMPSDFQKQLERLANIDEVAPKMLEAAASVVADELRRNVPVDNGELKKSIKVKSAKKTKSGAWIISITFDGTHKKPKKGGGYTAVPNAVKATVLEYGRKGQKGKKPFIIKSVTATQERAVEKMQEVFEELTK